MATYEPPADILDVLAQLDFEESLAPDDPRYIDTAAARGEQNTLDQLARKFGLGLNEDRSLRRFVPPTHRHVLFFGHVGSGKSTELRRYCQAFSGPDRYLVITVDVSNELDRNNFQYTDALMAIAESLLDRLEEKGVKLPPAALKPLETWFSESVHTSEVGSDVVASLVSGFEVKAGLPFLASVFGKLTSSFKTNVTYKDTLRRVVRNTFTQFVEAFNGLIRSAEVAAAGAGIAQRFLFLIDGTDKLRGEDRRRFFVDDAEQLLEIEAHVIYVAPLALKYEANLAGKLNADLVLPMIKLKTQDGTPFAPGVAAMRSILLARAAPSLFASAAEIDRLVQFSGGHPRELLRLLRLCCEVSDGTIDAATVDRAVAALAADYRRFIEPDDYAFLVEIDANPGDRGVDDRLRRLLSLLAVLEYNDGSWRRPHPVVQTLAGYREALAAREKRNLEPGA